MIKTARPIGAKPINEKEFVSKYNKQVRTGKTRKDKETGAHAARFANRAARVEWQHDPRATAATFPGA